MRIRRSNWVALIACGLATLLLPGCLFKMNHQLPPYTSFGGSAERAAPAQHFEDRGMKNYMLAGLMPWWTFGTKDLVEPPPGHHAENVKITTRFDWLDTVIWVVPGFFYGYYVWAPRHIEVEGDYVESKRPIIPAKSHARYSKQ